MSGDLFLEAAYQQPSPPRITGAEEGARRREEPLWKAIRSSFRNQGTPGKQLSGSLVEQRLPICPPPGSKPREDVEKGADVFEQSLFPQTSHGPPLEILLQQPDRR
jgi:hypothetical protein